MFEKLCGEEFEVWRAKEEVRAGKALDYDEGEHIYNLKNRLKNVVMKFIKEHKEVRSIKRLDGLYEKV